MRSVTDTQSIVIAKPASDVFAFMADSSKLDLWSFGTWKTSIAADGLVSGQSIFDGSTIYLRIDACAERLLIDYCLGSDPKFLQARIFARVIPGSIAGLEEYNCILIMTAIRSTSMADERWQRLLASHQFELELIKNLLETGFDHRQLNR